MSGKQFTLGRRNAPDTIHSKKMRNTTARVVAMSVVILLIAGRSIRAQEGASQPDSSPPTRIVMPRPVDVPLITSGVPGANLPVIEVMLNGHGPYRFGIETGAGFVAMKKAIADSLHLQRSGGPDEFPEYRADSVNVGSASFQGVTIVGMPRAATGVDGILGLPFYHEVLLTIDYPNHRARFEKASLPAANGRDILALTRVGPFWAVPLKLEGKTFQSVIDTRSTGTLSSPQSIADQLTFVHEPVVVGRAGGAAIPDREVKAGQLKGDAQLGRFTFPSPMLTIHSLPPGFPETPLIGSSVLENFAVSLDQRHARLRLSRNGSSVIELRAHERAPGVAKGNATLDLSVYVGQYGDRSVTVSNGVLQLQRPGGPPNNLVQTGTDAFGIAQFPAAKIEFIRDQTGVVTGIRVLTREGAWETAQRSK